MDRITQRLVENRLREIRSEMERQARDTASVDPLEKVWRRALRSQMREIDAALERLPDRGYGVCEQCGETISAERLHAVPWARKCFRCQTTSPEQESALLRWGVAVPLNWD